MACSVTMYLYVHLVGLGVVVEAGAAGLNYRARVFGSERHGGDPN